MPIHFTRGSNNITISRGSGSIKFVKQIPSPPSEPTQLLLNSEFTTGSTHWTGSFVTFSTSAGSRPAIYNNTLVFSHSDGFGTVTQTVDVSQNILEYERFDSYLKIKHIQNTSPWGTTASYSNVDKFYFMVEFIDINNLVITTRRLPETGTMNCPRGYAEYSLTLLRTDIDNFNDIHFVKVYVFGDDTGFWSGNYGPQVDYIRLYAI